MSLTSQDNSFTVSSDFRIRDTARKYKYARWTQEQQFSVDTAAVATAFPDFTQGSSDDLTIDLARVKNSPLPKSKSFPAIQSNSINNTDMLRQRVLNKTSTQKENMALDSSPYVSNASRTTSGERKQLAELRAQVQSDTENSTMGTERTTTTTFPPSKSRSSRFAQNKIDRSYKIERTDTQHTPANISARFTSPAKSVTKTIAQPTQSSFIIQATGDMTARDTEELGLPVIVEHGEVQQRKSSARRFRRVSGIRTPEEEKELWLLCEQLKAENAALKTRAEYQQHVNSSLQEQNSKILREVSEFKTKTTTELEMKITEMSRKVDMVMSENNAMKAQSAAIRAENAALSNEKEVEAHEISRLEAEMARLRSDFQATKNLENNTQQANTDVQFGSPRKVQKSATHTFRSESRVEFQDTNTDMQFEIPNPTAHQTFTRPSGPEPRAEAQDSNTDMQFELPNSKAQQLSTGAVRSESRVESHGTNVTMQFDLPTSKVQQTSTRARDGESGVEFQETITHEVSKFRARKASAQPFRPKSAVEEQTLRPSVDPQQALATVMAQLNDEIAELKEDYNQVTSQYMALDPAMKKRMRKEMKEEMDRLLRAIERKADQIYLLQDVQEGILPYEEGQ